MHDELLLELDIDTRLTNIWATVGSLYDDELNFNILGCALRCAYYQGYKDGETDANGRDRKEKFPDE